MKANWVIKIHKMVLCKTINMQSEELKGGPVCLFWAQRSRKKQVFGSLNSNENPEAHLQRDAPSTQLCFSLWWDQQQKVTASALLHVRELRINVSVCARERNIQSTFMGVGCWEDELFQSPFRCRGCHNKYKLYFQMFITVFFFLRCSNLIKIYCKILQLYCLDMF